MNTVYFLRGRRQLQWRKVIPACLLPLKSKMSPSMKATMLLYCLRAPSDRSKRSWSNRRWVWGEKVISIHLLLMFGSQLGGNFPIKHSEMGSQWALKTKIWFLIVLSFQEELRISSVYSVGGGNTFVAPTSKCISVFSSFCHWNNRAHIFLGSWCSQRRDMWPQHHQMYIVCT